LSWTLVLRAGEVQQVASFNGISWHQPCWRYVDLNQAKMMVLRAGEVLQVASFNGTS